jgi:peptidoglycan/xylan/chitin deacetylase (PgdA/CDA1 family)
VRQLGQGLKTAVRKSGVAGSVVGVRTSLPHVVLTYDDGPDPRGTAAILEALDERGASATFFVLLTRARVFGTLLEEILAGGHELALHGVDHQRLSPLPFAVVARRTVQAKAELEDLAGRRVRWMRPPYGAQTPSNWLAIRSAGLEPVMWTRTMWDSRRIPQSERVRKATEDPKPGRILLAHDGFANAGDGVDDGPEPDLDRGGLTRLVLEGFARCGLQGRSLSKALESGSLERATWLTRKGKA